MNDENYLMEWRAIRNPAVAKGAVRMLHTLAGWDVPAETWPLLHDVLDKYNVPLADATYAIYNELGPKAVCAYVKAIDHPGVHMGKCKSCEMEVPILDGDCLVCGSAVCVSCGSEVADRSGTPRA